MSFSCCRFVFFKRFYLVFWSYSKSALLCVFPFYSRNIFMIIWDSTEFFQLMSVKAQYLLSKSFLKLDFGKFLKMKTHLHLIFSYLTIFPQFIFYISLFKDIYPVLSFLECYGSSGIKRHFYFQVMIYLLKKGLTNWLKILKK